MLLCRAIFTVELPQSGVKETVIPEFAYAIEAFNKSGASFTGQSVLANALWFYCRFYRVD